MIHANSFILRDKLQKEKSLDAKKKPMKKKASSDLHANQVDGKLADTVPKDSMEKLQLNINDMLESIEKAKEYTQETNLQQKREIKAEAGGAKGIKLLLEKRAMNLEIYAEESSRNLEREEKEVIYLNKIRELEEQLQNRMQKDEEQKEKIKALQYSLAQMNDKIVDQVNETAEVAYAKEMVEAELEELSRKLFEQANSMVADERKKVKQTERKVVILERKIGEMEEQLNSERLQSAELKERIHSLYEEQTNKESEEDGISNSSNEGDGSKSGEMTKDSVQIYNAKEIGKYTDVLIYNEFLEFLHEIRDNSMAFKWQNNKFFRQVIDEDVEATLKFGPRPRISSRNILEAIGANTLIVEETKATSANRDGVPQSPDEGKGSKLLSTGRAMLWERLSGQIPANPYGCVACGKEGSCTYRIKLGLKAEEQWTQIDKSCRDRIVTVCEFYGFVRFLRRGYFTHENQRLFGELIRLRLCMFYARLGVLDFAATLEPSLSKANLLTNNGHSHGLNDNTNTNTNADTNANTNDDINANNNTNNTNNNNDSNGDSVGGGSGNGNDDNFNSQLDHNNNLIKNDSLVTFPRPISNGSDLASSIRDSSSVNLSMSMSNLVAGEPEKSPRIDDIGPKRAFIFSRLRSHSAIVKP